MPDPTENGSADGDMSIADRAELAAADEEMETLFPEGFIDGEPWNLAQIHKSRVPVEATVSLSRAEIPLRDGLPDPNKIRRVAVSTCGGKFEAIPTFEEQPDGRSEIVSWKIRATLRATYVEQMGTPEQVVLQEFEKLTLDSPQRAAEIANELVAFAARFPKV